MAQLSMAKQRQITATHGTAKAWRGDDTRSTGVARPCLAQQRLGSAMQRKAKANRSLAELGKGKGKATPEKSPGFFFLTN